MAELPSGTVTFLFTDLEGSTRRWEEHPEAMPAALVRHDEILRTAIEGHGGVVFSEMGDGMAAVFASPVGAVSAALDAQVGLRDEPWGEVGPLRARMGLHAGEGVLRSDGQYVNAPLNRCARLMAVAHGGQVVCSDSVEVLVRDGLAPSVSFADLGEHRLRDLAQPVRVFQLCADGLPGEFPRLRSVDAFPGNLPVQTTSFVGRDDDIAEVAKALDGARVVTLTGVGGVGKTRLAVQTAAELLPRFRDGAWFCELGPLSDPAGLPDVLAAALRVQPRGGMSMAESIVDALTEKEMLVVLDNCEHLIAAAARMVDAIVRACPGVRVLATSREGLGVRGERIMSVPSLELPLDGAPTEVLATSGAVRLFADRALEAGGGFVLDADNAAAVVALCNRLDGIPLALELAAARTRMMTPAEIAQRLDERFRLLTGGSRTAVERHQTLRQAVDWSYDLLEPREQTILDRLGVFAGGFTLDAAESVLADATVAAFDVLDSVAQLVDKSLVIADHEGEGTRYRLLETIRQYALERLDDSGGTDAVRRRHADWCADFAARASDGLRGPDEAVWISRPLQEIDNLRAGVTWAAGVDDADLALRLVGVLDTLHLIFRRLGYRLAGLAAVALTTTDALDHPLAARVLAIRGVDHLNHARADAAERDARDGIRLVLAGRSEPCPDPWLTLFYALLFSSRMEEFGDEIDAFSRVSAGDPYAEDVAGIFTANWLFVVTRAAEGLPTLERVLARAREASNPTLTMYACFGLGGALLDRDPDRARVLLLETIDVARQVDGEFFIGVALGWLARIDGSAVDSVWARQFRDAIRVAADHGDRGGLAVLFELLQESLVALGRPEPAAVVAGYARAFSRSGMSPVSVATTERVAALLIDALGAERVGELMQHGVAMTLADARDLAFAELDRVITDGAR